MSFDMESHRTIQLTRGLVTIVDVADYACLSRFKWYAIKSDNTFYAVRKSPMCQGKRTMILMHREILGLTDPKIEGEHRDRNGLNNTRRNLRPATRLQNACNRKKHSNNSSGYIGVTFNRTIQKWAASIKVIGVRKHLGYFDMPDVAARVRDAAAVKQYGEFARLNFGG